MFRKNKYDAKEREGILFIGGFSHAPNVDAALWFGKEIYPEILKRQNITFYIVGSNAPDEVKNLNTTGIKYKGFVSEHELCDLYQKVRIVVVPLRYGAGIKGKVVDAMYQEVPIISTSVGIEGILEAESCVEIADSKEFSKRPFYLAGR